MGIDRRSGVGGGESGDIQVEEWGGRGREWGYTGGGVGREGERGIDRCGVRGGEIGDRQEEEWVGEGESGDRSGVGGGE